MRPYLAMIMPVGESGPVDPGFGQPGVGAGIPSQPIYLPPGQPIHPTHPIFIQDPAHPEHPIALPPGSGLAPAHPITLPPPCSPSHPIVIPPGTPLVPTHPITLPDGGELPAGEPIYPAHPIVIHPPHVDAGLPPAPAYPSQGLPPTAQPKRK
jgi:hypothetical protein